MRIPSCIKTASHNVKRFVYIAVLGLSALSLGLCQTVGPLSGSVTKPAAKHSISGSVNGAGVNLTLSGASSASTKTGKLGNYIFTGLANGLYVIAPSKSGYTFTPSTALVSMNGASITGITFTATVAPPPVAPPPVSHSVSLTWVSSTSPNIRGYNVYRSTVSGAAYAKLNASPVGATSYIDSTVTSSQRYFYVATTVDSNNNESAYSTQATALVPTP